MLNTKLSHKNIKNPLSKTTLVISDIQQSQINTGQNIKRHFLDCTWHSSTKTQQNLQLQLSNLIVSRLQITAICTKHSN